MNITRSLIVAGGFVLASVAAGVWGQVNLPADAFLAYHRGFGDPATAHLPKAYALALMPAISALVVFCLAIAPRRSPNPEGLERSTLPYGMLIVGLAGVFFVTQIALVERMMNAGFDVLRMVFLSVGVLLLVLGNDLGKVRHNRVFGVRTPWTLKDPRVWDKTHRYTGRLMVLAGLILTAGCLLTANSQILIALVVLCAALPPLMGMGYSRRVFRREHQA